MGLHGNTGIELTHRSTCETLSVTPKFVEAKKHPRTKQLSLGLKYGQMLGMSFVLAACSNGYQAPIAEQGTTLVTPPPLIVDASTPDSSLRATSNRAVVAGSSAASTRSRSSAAIANTTANTRATSTVNTQARTHRVSRGETLYSIAYQYDLDFRALALANRLVPPYTIFVDQELSLNADNPVAPTSSVNSNLGTPVANNSVARAQGTNTTNTGVIRQAIGSASSIPSWRWPHSGRIVRNFSLQTKGIDIGGRQGDPVYAASDGDVVYSGRGIQGTGELIILRHSDRYLSAYAHNSAMLVKEGDRVEAGQQIAEVGNGPAGEAMLHFEIRVDGKSADPMEFLPRR